MVEGLRRVSLDLGVCPVSWLWQEDPIDVM
jgi:hypothetical protein